MNTNIFREYDIRSVVPHDLTPELVIGLGRALGPGASFKHSACPGNAL
jgi:phosphomannomutase